jgi:hypothetical protein
MRSVLRVELDERFPPTGGCKHTLVKDGVRSEFPPFVALEICLEGSGYYLMYCTETGLGTDGWHQSLEDAKRQAEFEFGVTDDAWIETNRDF